jgi:hypothetical protein
VVTAAIESPCALCDRPATLVIDPPRRTLDRGLDPSDESYSVTVLLPNIPLCDEHDLDVRQGDRLVGWCDDERCRTYGGAGETSACGEPYAQLAGTRSRSATSQKSISKQQKKQEESE